MLILIYKLMSVIFAVNKKTKYTLTNLLATWAVNCDFINIAYILSNKDILSTIILYYLLAIWLSK